MNIKPVRLNSNDIKDIEIGLNHLNNKYFKKKVWPFDLADLLSSGEALTMGEVPVKHLNVIWEKMIEDPYNDLSPWHEIKKKEKADLIIYVAKFKKFFSSGYYSNVEISFEKDKKGYTSFIGATAGKRVIDLYYNINEVLEFKDDVKFSNDTADAIKKYT
tara:strand:- start:398 stop:877 length:480 start_codon:yes stop_codon:yes gene_type:complete